MTPLFGSRCRATLSRLALQHHSTTMPHAQELEPVPDSDSDSLSVVSFSTTSTMSNLPGAGRTVGLAISYYGRRIERFLTAMALKLGRGPKNASLRVVKRLGASPAVETDYHAESYGTLTKEEKRARKDLNRLLNYAWFVHCCNRLPFVLTE